MKKNSALWVVGLGIPLLAGIFFTSFRQRPNNLIIGAALPLTGDLAFFGAPEKYAVQMAVEDLVKANTLKKDQVKIRIEDSRSTAKDGVSAVRKLLESNPKAVITSLTMISMPAAPILADRAIPQIALSVDPEIQKQAPTVHRLYYGFEDEMKAISEYAKSVNAKRVAIAWINTPELKSSIDLVLKPELQANGIVLSGSSPHTFSTTDFRSIMASLAATKPDLLILQDFGSLLPAMVDAARSQGMLNLVGGIGFMSSKEEAREQLSGIPFTLPKFLLNNNSNYQDFNSRFKRYSGGKTATYDIVFTYDATSILGHAVAKSMKTGQNLNSELSSIKSFRGIAGDLLIRDRALKVPLGWGQFSQQGRLVPKSKPGFAQ